MLGEAVNDQDRIWELTRHFMDLRRNAAARSSDIVQRAKRHFTEALMEMSNLDLALLVGTDEHGREQFVWLSVTETSGFGFDRFSWPGVSRKWNAHSMFADATGTASSLEEAKRLAIEYGEKMLPKGKP